MPQLNTKVPGDNFYPQYNSVTREKVGAITVTKGRLYTKGTGASGNQLIAPGATGFANGIYQATRTIATAGSAGEHEVDCFGHRSRIGLPAKVANLHAGQRVQYDPATFNVTAWTVAGATPTLNEINNLIGRIYKIHSRTDIRTEKDVSAVGDTLIIDLAGAI